MKRETFYLEISRKEDLNKLNNLDGYKTVIIDFMEDIVFDENEKIEPIDLKDKTVFINGRNYSIINLNIDKPDIMEVGLIKRAGNLIIKNLNIINARINSGEISGTLVGKVDEDLVVKNMDLDSRIVSDSICGGICGIAKNIYIKNSNINAKIRGRGVLGGICGMSNTYKEDNVKVKCHLKSPYSKYVNDLAIGKKVGYLSSQRDRSIKNMLLETQGILLRRIR